MSSYGGEGLLGTRILTWFGWYPAGRRRLSAHCQEAKPQGPQIAALLRAVNAAYACLAFFSPEFRAAETKID